MILPLEKAIQHVRARRNVHKQVVSIERRVDDAAAIEHEMDVIDGGDITESRVSNVDTRSAHG
jgi:hypothetical protein